MNFQNIKRIFLLVNVAFLFSSISVANAATDLVGPQIAIEKASLRLKANLRDESFLNDFAKVSRFVQNVIEPHMDFNKISKLVVGKYWRRATNNERLNFEKEFKILLVRTYSRAFVDFNEWHIQFSPLDMDKDVKMVRKTKAVTVKTKIIQPSKNPFSINYKMWLINGQWKAYDIVIEGISLVKNFRTSISGRMNKPGASLTTVTEYLAKKNIKALNRDKED